LSYPILSIRSGAQAFRQLQKVACSPTYLMVRRTDSKRKARETSTAPSTVENRRNATLQYWYRTGSLCWIGATMLVTNAGGYRGDGCLAVALAPDPRGKLVQQLAPSRLRS
jgi:hypothetical protein